MIGMIIYCVALLMLATYLWYKDCVIRYLRKELTKMRKEYRRLKREKEPGRYLIVFKEMGSGKVGYTEVYDNYDEFIKEVKNLRHIGLDESYFYAYKQGRKKHDRTYY